MGKLKSSRLKYKTIATVLLFLFMGMIVEAQTLSLDSAISKVENNYPSLKVYDAKINSIIAKSKGSKSWMPPTVSAGLNRIPYNYTLINDPMMRTLSGAMFSVEQMIPNASKLQAKENYLVSLSSAENSKKEWTKNLLMWQTKQLYYQRYIAEKNIKIIEASEQLLQFLITSAESKYNYNQSGLSTIFKAKAKLEDLKNMKSMQMEMIEESNIGLNTLMNRSALIAFAIDTLIELKNYETILAPSTTDSIVLKRNDLLTMDNTIKSMQLDKELMAKGSRPDFGVRFDHMQMFNMGPMYSVMGMITIPIVPWASKMYKSDVKAMGFQIQSMQHEKDDMQLMANRMIYEKISMLKYTKEQLQNYDSGIIPSYQKNFDASMLAFKQNTGDLFVVIDSWEMLLMKQLERNQVLASVLKLEADYEKEIEK
jgi:cobalt-zinc-cadmium efflux system outer membrane protein